MTTFAFLERGSSCPVWIEYNIDNIEPSFYFILVSKIVFTKNDRTFMLENWKKTWYLLEQILYLDGSLERGEYFFWAMLDVTPSFFSFKWQSVNTMSSITEMFWGIITSIGWTGPWSCSKDFCLKRKHLTNFFTVKYEDQYAA